MARNIGADKIAPESLLDVLIHAGLIAVLAIICYRVFHPFMDLLLFIGPVILAIGYELIWQWVDTAPYEIEPAKTSLGVASPVISWSRGRAGFP